LGEVRDGKEIERRWKNKRAQRGGAAAATETTNSQQRMMRSRYGWKVSLPSSLFSLGGEIYRAADSKKKTRVSTGASYLLGRHFPGRCIRRNQHPRFYFLSERMASGTGYGGCAEHAEEVVVDEDSPVQ